MFHDEQNLFQGKEFKTCASCVRLSLTWDVSHIAILPIQSLAKKR